MDDRAGQEQTARNKRNACHQRYCRNPQTNTLDKNSRNSRSCLSGTLIMIYLFFVPSGGSLLVHPGQILLYSFNGKFNRYGIIYEVIELVSLVL